jgi:hypothetical protein
MGRSRSHAADLSIARGRVRTQPPFSLAREGRPDDEPSHRQALLGVRVARLHRGRAGRRSRAAFDDSWHASSLRVRRGVRASSVRRPIADRHRLARPSSRYPRPIRSSRRRRGRHGATISFESGALPMAARACGGNDGLTAGRTQGCRTPRRKPGSELPPPWRRKAGARRTERPGRSEVGSSPTRNGGSTRATAGRGEATFEA